jgi:tetratricopeptide (TPR) repeat protein
MSRAILLPALLLAGCAPAVSTAPRSTQRAEAVQGTGSQPPRVIADPREALEAQSQAAQAERAKHQQARIDKLLDQARAAIDKKDFDQADKLIAQAVALDPTNLAAGRAQRELRAGRQAQAQAKSAMTEEAKKKADAELARKKEEFARLMREGREALAAEDYEKASKLFTAAAKLNPDDHDAPLLLGMADKYKIAAQKEVEEARRAAAEEEERMKKEAEAEKEKQRQAEDAKARAEAELRKKLEADVEAKKKADRLRAVTKAPYDAAMRDGQKALADHRYDDAVKAYERALQLIPDDGPAKAGLAQAKGLRDGKPAAPLNELLARAADLQEQGEWAEALVMYRQAQSAHPENKQVQAGLKFSQFQVHMGVGREALKKKDRKSAVEAFEAALKLFPDDAAAKKLLEEARGKM